MSQPEITLATIKPGREGWVYLIHAEGSNRYKIGRSINPIARAKDLEKQSPYPLRIVKTFYTPDAVEDEAELHSKFSPLKAYGEWFEFPPEKAERYTLVFYSYVLWQHSEYFWNRYSIANKWLRYQNDWGCGEDLEKLVTMLVNLTIGKHNHSDYWAVIYSIDSLFDGLEEYREEQHQEIFFVIKGILIGVLAVLINKGITFPESSYEARGL